MSEDIKPQEAEEQDVAQPQGTARERFVSKMRERYADEEFADDEAVYERALKDYDDYDQMRERENKLKGMIEADPRAASVLVDLADGKDALLGLIRRFGPELKNILDDPEEQERLAGEMAAHLDKVAADKKYEEEYHANLQTSMDTADEVQAEKGWTAEQMDEVIGAIVGIGKAVIMGVFPRETFDMVGKALHYDADVAEAREEGEIAGRNAKIDENRLALRRPSDGQPALGGSSATASEPAEDNIFALAAQAR